MSDRVLNFSEFFTKYSKEGQDGAAKLDSIETAASNFEKGFDDQTYDQKPIGPNRQIAGSTEVAPPQPGEEGAPAFSAEIDADLEAPEEPKEEKDKESPEPKKEEKEEKKEEDEDDTPEPEAGANPKKEKLAEALVMGFGEFINEYHHEDFEEDMDDSGEYSDFDNDFDNDRDEHLLGLNPFDEDDEDTEEEVCPNCGEPIRFDEESNATCGCNM